MPKFGSSRRLATRLTRMGAITTRATTTRTRGPTRTTTPTAATGATRTTTVAGPGTTPTRTTIRATAMAAGPIAMAAGARDTGGSQKQRARREPRRAFRLPGRLGCSETNLATEARMEDIASNYCDQLVGKMGNELRAGTYISLHPLHPLHPMGISRGFYSS